MNSNGMSAAPLARTAESSKGLICIVEDCATITSNSHSLVQQAKQQHLKVHKSSAMRLAGVGIACLVAEEDKLVLYHCLANDNKQHASGRDYCEGTNQARASCFKLAYVQMMNKTCLVSGCI